MAAAHDSKTVDYAGVSKADVLRALWENASLCALFKDAPEKAPGEWCSEEMMEEGFDWDITYYLARNINVDLSADNATFDPTLYDKTSKCAAAVIIADLKIKALKLLKCETCNKMVNVHSFHCTPLKKECINCSMSGCYT